MNKLILLFLTIFLTASCSSKKDIEGRWNCDVVNVGRVTLVFNDKGSLQIIQNGATLGYSRYSVMGSGNIKVVDPDGSTFVLTRNEKW